MRRELGSALVGDHAGLRHGAVPGEEVTVVVTGEEACLLALGARGGGEPGARRLRPRGVLVLLAEWEPEALEAPRVEAREHVRLVLRGVDGAMEEHSPAMLGLPAA